MYKIFMIIGLVVVAVGWVAYALWDYKLRREEEKEPPKRSQRFRQTQGEVSDWAKQMAQFEKPKAKRQAKGDQDTTE